MPVSFRITHQQAGTAARTGLLSTPHGEIETPVFMPVGTKATVKSMTPEELVELGSQIILSNTFHLWLRPGDELIARMGGLHRFMHWERPILTDSGGFQVWSLAKLRRMEEEGVRFQSPLDGTRLFLTPEKATAIQENLGADIIMVFDECTSYPATFEYAKASAERTARWAERCRRAQQRGDEQALFGIVQGGVYPALREWSARATVEIGFPGYAIGGLSVGETKQEMEDCLDVMDRSLPREQARYLMGVGTPEDFFRGVERGIDMFDCVLPTRTARTGRLYTNEGILNIRNARHAEEDLPISCSCRCYTCRHYSRAYVRHLFMANEILASRLATTHNLFYFLDLMAGIREAIRQNRLAEYKKSALASYRSPGEANLDS